MIRIFFARRTKRQEVNANTRENGIHNHPNEVGACMLHQFQSQLLGDCKVFVQKEPLCDPFNDDPVIGTMPDFLDW